MTEKPDFKSIIDFMLTEREIKKIKRGNVVYKLFKKQWYRILPKTKNKELKNLLKIQALKLRIAELEKKTGGLS